MSPESVPLRTGVSLRMARQRKRDTAPEMALRRQLHASGFRFRVSWPVPGMPRRTIDVAFTRQLVAVFVDGCFWHGCPIHGTSPKSNAEWWASKIARNQFRDRETTLHLEQAGWVVVRLWEHEELPQATSEVVGALRSRNR